MHNLLHGTSRKKILFFKISYYNKLIINSNLVSGKVTTIAMGSM